VAWNLVAFQYDDSESSTIIDDNFTFQP
jgi:hypothetical protein